MSKNARTGSKLFSKTYLHRKAARCLYPLQKAKDSGSGRIRFLKRSSLSLLTLLISSCLRVILQLQNCKELILILNMVSHFIFSVQEMANCAVDHVALVIKYSSRPDEIWFMEATTSGGI